MRITEAGKLLEDSGITYFVSAAGHAGYAYHAESTVFQCKREFGYESPALKKYATMVSPGDRKIAWRQLEEKKRFGSKLAGRVQEMHESVYSVKKYAEFSYRAKALRG